MKNIVSIHSPEVLTNKPFMPLKLKVVHKWVNKLVKVSTYDKHVIRICIYPMWQITQDFLENKLSIFGPRTGEININ